MRPAYPWCVSLAVAVGLSTAGCEAPPESIGPTPSDVIQRPDVRLPARDLPPRAYSLGQTVYVPVYSQVQTMIATRAYALTANIVVHNTDIEDAIDLTSARYYDNDGNLVTEYLTETRTLQPLASTTLIVEQLDREGGIGANFVIDWNADTRVSEPVIEAVMIGEAGTQGVAFVSSGRVIKEYSAAESVGESP